MRDTVSTLAAMIAEMALIGSPLVSVLTPVWNEERHIDAMIASLLDQSYEHWEAIFVDDGSTDFTVARIQEHAQEDARIRVMDPAGRLGKVKAFNRAFSASRGQIVCHVGGDDLARPGAMQARVDALRDFVALPAVAFFRINMFTHSPDKGTVLPRGAYSSRSGPSTTLTRTLAERVFPVPEHLPSEDLWIGEASYGLAEHIVHSRHIVADYRIHLGNSNPRFRSFEEMSESIHQRMQFAPALLLEERFALDEGTRRDLEQRWSAEQLRHEGRTLAILLSSLDPVDRLAIAAMSNRVLWGVRKSLYRSFSGWRGR